MAESAFISAAAPGAIGATGFDAYSMMQRATLARQQQEMNDLNMEKLQAEMPSIVAKARADQASNEAALRARSQMENLRRNGAQASVQANEEYIGALAIPDWDAQARALSKLQAKYGWLGNVRDDGGQPIYKGFLDALDNSTANAAMRGKIAQSIQGQLQVQGGKTEAAVEAAKIRADAAKALAEERANTQKLLADQKNETAVQIAELRAANKMSPDRQKFAEERGTAAAKYFNGVQEKTAEHQRTLDTINSNRQMLESGSDQGLGEESKMMVMQTVNALTRTAGAGDVFDTSKPEQLKRNYSDFALAAASRMKNQGQITESERKLLADTVAKFKDSKKGALLIMDYMQAVAQREIAKAQWLNQRLQENGLVGPEDEPKFYEENPLSYFLPARGEEDKDPVVNDEVENVLKKYRKPNG